MKVVMPQRRSDSEGKEEAASEERVGMEQRNIHLLARRNIS
jgi:hypothetical protein